MIENSYSKDGYLIVSELWHCSLFEKDKSAPKSCSADCFFCKYSDFRKREYIERLENAAQDGVLFSVCHNENNKNNNTNSEAPNLRERG